MSAVGATTAAGAAPHVLLVDDYPDALEVWTLLLQASGYTVATATTGAAALACAAERAPSVAVLDLQLPDLAGLEVGRRLRQLPETAAATLIALTGRALDAEAQAELERVFDAVLIKPCEPADLLGRVDAGRRTASKPA